MHGRPTHWDRRAAQERLDPTCVDFSIWEPNHHRLQKKHRNTGLQLHVGGTFAPGGSRLGRLIYTRGWSATVSWRPPWWGCGAVGLGPLLDNSSPHHRVCQEVLEPHSVLCCTKSGFALTRLEHMERLRRTVDSGARHRSCTATRPG